MPSTSRLALSAAVSIVAWCAQPTFADPVVLDFEGIAPYPSSSDVQIQDFYNGGTSSAGTSGPNYGVGFSNNALAVCLNTIGTTCSNGSRGGLAPGSEFGALYFLFGESTALNYTAGFDTGFSFNYSDTNTEGGFVSVYSGLDGTGTLLGTINLTLTPSTCDPAYAAEYCPFVPIGVTFDGTAQSIVFGGVANHVTFDDITFGSATPGDPGDPGGVPEPASWAMLITGFGLVGGAMRRRQAVPRLA